MRTWSLSELEFYVLWTDMTKDVLPDPFLFVSDIKTQDDLEREVIKVRDRLRGATKMRQILGLAADPDLSVVVQGSVNCPDAGRKHLRMLAARRESDGYVITQLPGDSFWRSAGYSIVWCEAVGLADMIVDGLPVNDAGRVGEVPLTAYSASADREFDVGRSAVIDSFDEPDSRRSAQFLRSKTSGEGEIEVIQGRSVFGPRGITRRRFSWRDLEDDGRYIIRDGRPPVAVPVDSGQFVSMLNAHIASIVRVIRDERR
ncbi:ESX secretion-associated protein EspG [Nocardia caishijiensis]|uniref:ESAT-6 protein secretion system EspG family protein n=1 Tax=Nocardia caishijiensis TaxID=184756 RepID=A0ABQ6YR55_9NOCA|nr:ESX secretion-associated protein EspG [Nocardia caishijiensis]KAF0848279.1 ESAT-6 protein secretion system EspG family protein [Nocardia caishijiensis]